MKLKHTYVITRSHTVVRPD